MSSPGLSVVLLLSCCLHCFPMQGAGAAAAHDNNGSCQLYKLFGVYAGVFLRKRGTVRPFFIALSRPYPGSGVLLGRAVQALSGFARPAWPRCGQSGPCLGFVRMPWAFFPSLCLGLICCVLLVRLGRAAFPFSTALSGLFFGTECISCDIFLFTKEHCFMCIHDMLFASSWRLQDLN